MPNSIISPQIYINTVKVAWSKSRIKGWDARRTVKMKAQQPNGCEHFIKTSNAADRLLGGFYLFSLQFIDRIRRSRLPGLPEN